MRSYKVDMYEEVCRESRKEITESNLEKPQAMAQSYSVLEKSSCNCETVHSELVSLHTHLLGFKFMTLPSFLFFFSFFFFFWGGVGGGGVCCCHSN